ncbi:amino acid/polyamine transporter I [Aspergillus californicus]
MDEPKKAPVTPHAMGHSSSDSLERGTIEEPHKPFSTLTAIGIGHGITNTAVGLLISLGSTLPFGGAPAMIYGFIAMAIVGLCCAISLAELSSAYPHAGGQYFWVYKLAPKKYRGFLSCTTGILSWAGAVCTGASATLVVSTMTFAIVKLFHPDFVVETWMICLGYQATLCASFLFNFFERALSILGKFLLATTVLSIVVIFVSMLAGTSNRQPAGEVFGDFLNISGWPTGVAFFLGLNGPNWCFSCLDAAVHLADEVPNPAKNIPKALLWTIAVGAVTGFPLIIALFFSIQDMDEVINDATGNPSLVAFLQIFSGNRAAAVALNILPIVSTFGAVIGVHTWQSRMAWAFARNRGFPFASYLAKIAPAPFDAPIWAHLWSLMFSCLLGFLYLASQTAFSSLISAGILFQYMTYSTAIALLLRSSRKTLRHGPFWMPKMGFISNVVVLVWTVAILFFYSFPYYNPVVANEMNYTSCIVVGFLVYSVAYWFLYGRSHFVLMDADDH